MLSIILISGTLFLKADWGLWHKMMKDAANREFSKISLQSYSYNICGGT